MAPITTVHVTHEACEKIGGIGAVLEGLITSPVYQQAVGRTILVGPAVNHFDVPPEARLGAEGEVLYSSLDGIDRTSVGYRFRPIEWAFNVAIIYGRRRFRTVDGRDGSAEVLLVDVFQASMTRTDRFKATLWQRFGLDCRRYQEDWGFEEYVRLAEPGFHAAMAIIRPEEMPAVVIAHEFMGLPLAFKAILDGQEHTRTVFHAHECSTARRLVEQHPGHDLAFYGALAEARRRRVYVTDLFGDQCAHFRHELVSRSHLCDAILAVGELVGEEVHFLDSHFDHHHIDLVHNGVPAERIAPETRLNSRRLLREWAQRVTGKMPDLIMTHVTRPVVSKGIWRDMLVCEAMEERLAAEGRTAILVILTSAGGVRRAQDTALMAEEYGWPATHRVGYPDLVGPEIELAQMVDEFNSRPRSGAPAIQAVLVNQFGFGGDAVGTPDLPLSMGVLRTGADVEFGMAVYEPFGISPLEPLAAGGICVISSVCGCAGFVTDAAGPAGHPCVIVADFTEPHESNDIATRLAIGRTEREAVERRVAADVADRLISVMPRTDADRLRLLDEAHQIIGDLGWDAVLREHLLPTLRRVIAAPARGSA